MTNRVERERNTTTAGATRAAVATRRVVVNIRIMPGLPMIG
jgi:hypothetical protein